MTISQGIPRTWYNKQKALPEPHEVMKATWHPLHTSVQAYWLPLNASVEMARSSAGSTGALDSSAFLYPGGLTSSEDLWPSECWLRHLFHSKDTSRDQGFGGPNPKTQASLSLEATNWTIG